MLRYEAWEAEDLALKAWGRALERWRVLQADERTTWRQRIRAKVAVVELHEAWRWWRARNLLRQGLIRVMDRERARRRGIDAWSAAALRAGLVRR